jgi:hypothetical protein
MTIMDTINQTASMNNAELLEYFYAQRDWVAYRNLYEQRWKNNHKWFRARVKQLGYKSIAEFCEKNPQGVVAGTVSGWFRGNSVINIGHIDKLCYALRVSPNDLLTVLGYYNPKKQTLQALESEENA